jgi:hypothetical protein
MKSRYMMLILAIGLALMLIGCGPAGEPESATSTESGETPIAALADATPTPAEILLSDVLPEDYEDALSARNQLALGLIRLDGTEVGATGDQAKTLATLWQALKALDLDPNSAQEESSAVQIQILNTMNDDQIEAIKALKLTNAVLNEFYADQGIELPTPDPDVTPSSVRMKDLSEEEREAAKATKAALGTPVGTGSGGGSERKTVLLDTLIELLQSR